MWNEREAREDFLRVAHLDPAMAAAVKKELKLLGERMRKKHVEDRKRYQGLFQQPRGGRAGMGGKQQEEVGCHGGEQGVGMEEVGVGEGEQGMAGDGRGKEAWGRGTAQGEAEVVGNGVGQGGEVKLGVCKAELESCGEERGVEGWEEEEVVEEEEGKVTVEEEGKEIVEKEEGVVKEAEEEEKEKTMEEKQKGKKEAVEEEEEREETVEREKDMGEEKEERKEAVEGEEEVGNVEEEDGVEEVEAVVEKQEGKKETVEETVEKEEEKEKVEEENSAAEMEKLAEGQCEESDKGELVLGKEAGGANRTGAKSVAGEESGRAAEQAPAYLDQGTFQGELGKGSCGGQQADNLPSTNITNGAVLQAGPLGADEELDGGTETPPYLTPVEERGGATSGLGAPLEQCRESKELEAPAMGHRQA